MSFLAKLFLDDTERQVLNADILIRQATDWIGRPDSQPQGGLINIRIKSTHETLFWDWMISPTMMKNGYIRFYKHDGMSKFADLEFWDCHCIDYYESYDANSTEALDMHLTLSPGVSRFKDIVFEKNWKTTDLSAQNAPTITFAGNKVEEESGEEIVPEITEMYYTDLEGNRIDELVEKKVKLIIKTRNMIGDMIDIDFNNESFNFKYKDKILEGDVLENYKITSNTEEIELEVIEEHSEE